MFKKIIGLVLICALVSCEKSGLQSDINEQVSASRGTKGSTETKGADGIISLPGSGNSGSGLGSVDNDVRDLTNGLLGNVVNNYPSGFGTIDMMYEYSLPCQPDIPYFIFGNATTNDDGYGLEYGASFTLVLNDDYYESIDIVDIQWDMDGQPGVLPTQSFSITDLGTGNHTITCQVYTTNDNSTVYMNELTFEFSIDASLPNDPEISYRGAGEIYTCLNADPDGPRTGTFAIICP